MKTINQLPEKSRKFIESLQTSTVAISPLATLVFAKVFSDLALLPSSKLESENKLGDITNSSASFAIKQFYAFTCEPSIKETLFAINESVVLDTNSIIEASRRFYLTRYNILYNSFYYPGIGPGLDRVFGLDQYLTKDDIKILSEQSEEFLRIYNSARDLVNSYQG